MNNHYQTIDKDVVKRAIDTIGKVVGQKWIDRKLEKVAQKEAENRSRVQNRKHTYLLDPQPHPLIEWIKLGKAWLAEAERSGEIGPNQQAMLLSKLAWELGSVEGLPGFEKIPPRLRLDSEFHATAFECEIAASYVREGASVKFVGEESRKTPDLEVSRQPGKTFFAECKTRETQSARDERVQGVMLQTQAAINRKLGPRKANAMIAIRSNSDPVHTDIDPLVAFIVQAAEQGGCGDIVGGEPSFERVLDGKFDVVVKRLANPDEIIREPIQIPNGKWDRETCGSELNVGPNGDAVLRNPWGFAFVNVNPSDMVQGIEGSLKTATSQIPDGGPGVIWIRLPLGTDESDFLSRGREVAESFLQPTQNRRVNAVIIRSAGFEQEQSGNQVCVRYRSQQVQVNHPNPRALSVAR